MRILLFLFLSIYTIATWAGVSSFIDASPQADKISDPTPARFSICYQHTCSKIDQVALTPVEWQSVKDIFSPKAMNAEEERSKIARAIAQLEVLVGRKVHTLNDRGGNFKGFLSGSNQLDCVDESTNSTTYLSMIEKDQLLRFHTTMRPAMRGFLIIGGWPHWTAVIKENTTGKLWAVDSWFRDNGVEPDILLLKTWRAGWRPRK